MGKRLTDKIVRATAGNGSIRLIALSVTNSSLEARSRHNLSFITTSILARAFSAALMLASSMKINHGRVTFRIRSDGPLKGLMVDAGRDGKVRGYVGNPNLELDPIIDSSGKYTFDFKKAVGTGYVNVLRDNGVGDPFSSTVEVVNGNIAEDLASYLLYSEQTPSAVFIGEKFQDNKLVCSGGLLAQVLPKKETDPLLVSLLEERCREIKSFSEELANSENNLLSLIKNIFPDIDDKELSENARSQKIEFKCKCSRERSLGAMRMLDKKELEDILKKEGKAELVCEFCKSKYSISYEEIKNMLR